MFCILICFAWFIGIALSQTDFTTTNQTTENFCVAPIVLNSTVGSITSPLYPQPYPRGLQCEWRIEVPGDKVVIIEFNDVDIYHSYNCWSDYMQVLDGEELYTGRRFCGTTSPKNFTAFNNIVTVRLVSDSYEYYYTNRGFNISWHTIDRCNLNEYTCWNGSCISETKHCDLVNDCMDNSDEIECAHISTNLSECGKLSVSPHFTWDPRIVGGNEVQPGSWPWQVALTYSPGGRSFCGGSIINERWVVTAAHCVDYGIYVVAGRHEASGSADEVSTEVDRIIIHPNGINVRHDIALLKLNFSLTFSDTIRPICVPTNTSDFYVKAGTICVSTGWGDLEWWGSNSDSLYQVRLPIVSNEECNQMYNSHGDTIYESNICAGDVGTGGVGPCHGDSGGPLTCYIGNTWYLMGVTSWGYECGTIFPGVYERVPWFHDWIQEVMSREFESCTDTVFTDITGNFSTPPYDGEVLSNNNVCIWTVLAPENSLIEVRFVNVVYLGFCRQTRLAVYDGESLYTVQEFCGYQKIADFISSTNNVTFVLRGGYSVSIQVAWEIKEKCTNNGFACWDGSQCISESSMCDGVRDCADDSDEIECPQLSSNFSECGKTNVAPGFTWNPRIVGGSKPTNASSWPWQASIYDYSYPVCSGSIIGSKWVLSSASCLQYWDSYGLSVRVGPNGTFHTVVSVTSHPNYWNYYIDEYDISIVEVSPAFTFSSTLRPICLSTNNDDIKIGETCIAIGTGENGVSYDTKLYQVRLPVLDYQTCLNYSYYNFTEDSVFCAGYTDGRESGTCYGDQGGPLMCLIGENTWTQIGVATQATTCYSGIPSFFVKTSFHAEWIADVLDGHYNECGERYFNSSSGVITSPGYPGNYLNNLDCQYTITTSSGKVISIAFQHFDLESCCDYVKVYDGTQMISGELNGNDLPPNFIAYSTILRLVFHTDPSVTYTGFSISWTIWNLSKPNTTTSLPTPPTTGNSTFQPPECESQNYTSSSGIITSPGYPGNYFNNLDCEYIITTSSGMAILLSFQHFDLEPGYDYLEIYDGTQLISEAMTGNHLPPNFIAYSTILRLVFHSDSSITSTGFFISWTTSNSSMPNTTTSLPIWPTTDNPTIQPSVCESQNFTSSSGVITSPGYPGNYSNNLDCEYIISALPHLVIEISVDHLDIEHHPTCDWDYLEVYDGSELYTGTRLCGTQAPHNFAAFSTTVRIVFHTDSIITWSGFAISWRTAVRCSDNQFTCWDGSCIAEIQHCDEVSDCPHGEDEIECMQGIGSTGHCGTVDVPPSFTWGPRIVGGSAATPGSYPWMAMLTDQHDNFFCGATIINDNTILTAAHCVQQNIYGLRVHVGRHHYHVYGNQSVQAFDVDSVILHENYSNTVEGFDIALLHLNGTIIFTRTVKPICIPPSSQGKFELKPEMRCIATGWGRLASGGHLPTELFQVRLPIVDADKCNNSYIGSLLNSQICAGDYDKGGIDTCQGDSGGPLICLFGETAWYQVGVTSYGIGCALLGYPGVYTRVSSFYYWIMNNVNSPLPPTPTQSSSTQRVSTQSLPTVSLTTGSTVAQTTSSADINSFQAFLVLITALLTINLAD